MKKIILISVLLLVSAAVSFAQPRAIGIRAGWGGEISYQHTFENNFIEADLGWAPSGIQVTANYDFIIGQYNWTPGTWTWYAGPGATVGAFNKSFTVGITGQMGLEYKVPNVPLALSIDIRPQLGFVFSGDTHLYNDLGGILCPFIAIRYTFGK